MKIHKFHCRFYEDKIIILLTAWEVKLFSFYPGIKLQSEVVVQDLQRHLVVK